MDKIFDENTVAIIVAVEDYRFDQISTVKYALNDAEAFKAVLIENLGLNPENIKTFYNSNASKTALENDIKYFIGQLHSNERFIFYYAGHGFHDGTSNRISAHDTNANDYESTTISLKDILITPLSLSPCQRSLIFLDTCSQYIAEKASGRSSISNIIESEFSELVKASDYCATFFSCSPGEKSHSDDNLSHGIWTFHLLKALSGKVPEATINERFVTDLSLRKYLRNSVSQFILKNTDIRNTQTPTASINAATSFLIYELPQPELSEGSEGTNYPNLLISLTDDFVYNESFHHITKAKGFKYSHFTPISFNSSADNFIKSIMITEIREEIQNTYQKSKDLFSLKRRDISKETIAGKGTLKNFIFEYEIIITQSTKAPALASVYRKIKITDPENTLLNQIDNIFPKKFNTISINVALAIENYDDIVEKFENLAERDNERIEDDDRFHQITYFTSEGLILILDFAEQKGLITSSREFPLINFISKVESFLDTISNGNIKIIAPSSLIETPTEEMPLIETIE